MTKRSNFFVTSFSLLAAALLFAGPASHRATAFDGGVVSSGAVSHLGLTIDWMTQLDVGPGAEIAGMGLHINENESSRFFEVNSKWRVNEDAEGVEPLFATQREVIDTKDMNAFGKPYEDEGALQYAMVRRDVIEAELTARGRKGIEVTVNKNSAVDPETGATIDAPLTMPLSIIYASTSTGLVVAMNADTGQTIWKTRVGDSRYLTTGPGFNDDFVAVCNGSRVYCLDATNGKLLWDVQSTGSPSAPPAIGSTQVYVVLTNGRLEALPLEKKGIGAKTFVGVGSGAAAPLITDRTVSWATMGGYYSVVPLTAKQKEAKKDERVALRADKILYRLRADGELLSAGTAADGNLYVTSVDGFIYAIDERTGSISWEFSTGDRIETSAFPHKGHLFVVTEMDKLYKLKTSNGIMADGWNDAVSGVSRFLGVSGEKVFVQDAIGNLLVLDTNTGTDAGIAFVKGLDFSMQNIQTNRLYVGNRNGLIQCVRESDSPTPVFHNNDGPAEVMVATDAPKEADNGGEDPNAPDPFAKFNTPDAGSAPAAGNNPFGSSAPAAGDNPFGGSAPASGDNPFGGATPSGGDNPFGGSAPASGDNPFGGGGSSDDNPFGG